MDDHWNILDFVVLKVDMRNTFNLVFSQAVLDECGVHLPELLLWAHGAMARTQYYSTQWELFVQRLVCNKGTL